MINYLNILFLEIYKILFLLIPVLVAVAMIVWLDRRVWAFVQKRRGPNVKQILGQNSVQLARGEDRFNHHKFINRNDTLMSEKSMLLRKKENEYLQEIFYKGAKQKGSY